MCGRFVTVKIESRIELQANVVVHVLSASNVDVINFMYVNRDSV